MPQIFQEHTEKRVDEEYPPEFFDTEDAVVPDRGVGAQERNGYRAHDARHQKEDPKGHRLVVEVSVPPLCTVQSLPETPACQPSQPARKASLPDRSACQTDQHTRKVSLLDEQPARQVIEET